MSTKKSKTAGPLRSGGITRFHSYHGPVLHPAAVQPLSRFSVMGPTYASADFSTGRRGLPQFPSAPCVGVPSLPPRRRGTSSRPTSMSPAAFAPNLRARPPVFSYSRGHSCVRFRYGPSDSLAIPRMVLSAGFKGSVSFPPAAQVTGLWLLPWHVYLLLSALSINLVARVGAELLAPSSPLPPAPLVQVPKGR